MSMNERDKQLLAMVGMTEEQAERNAEIAESETIPDGLVGPVYYGLHMLPQSEEEMVSMTIKLPKSQLDKVTATAKSYHISRSEYVRRQLAGAL